MNYPAQFDSLRHIPLCNHHATVNIMDFGTNKTTWDKHTKSKTLWQHRESQCHIRNEHSASFSCVTVRVECSSSQQAAIKVKYNQIKRGVFTKFLIIRPD